MSGSQPDLQCGRFRARQDKTRWTWISWVTTQLLVRQSPVREGTKPKHTFSLTVDISGKVTRSKVKTAPFGPDNRIVETCLSTLDHA